jgi:hypothetical protein
MVSNRVGMRSRPVPVRYALTSYAGEIECNPQTFADIFPLHLSSVRDIVGRLDPHDW